MTRSLLLLTLALLVAPLQSTAAEQGDTQRTELRHGHGMVMMRLIMNRGITNGFPKFEQLTVQDAKTGRRHRMRDVYGEGRYGMYVGSLPPGEYVAEEMQAGAVGFWAAGGESWDADFFPAGAWRFKVEKGRMTNLGTMLMVIPYSPLKTSRFRWVHIPDETLPQRSAYLLNPRDYPTLLGAALSWTHIGPKAAYDWLPIPNRRMSMALSGATKARDGGLLFGEHYGQIAWRHPNGRWSWEDTGTIESILFVVDAADGTRYATAEGSILLRRNGPGDWQRIPVPIADSRPCLAYADPDGSLLFAWEHSMKADVMRYRPGAETPWTKERQFSTFSAGNAIMGNTQGLCRGMITSRNIVLASAPWGWMVIRTTEADVYDIATREWKHQNFGMGGPLGVFPNGDLHLMVGGVKKQTFNVSSDLGANWEVRGLSDYLNSPSFRDSLDGIAIGGTHSTLYENWLKRTTDGGRTWEKGIKLPGQVFFFMALPGEELLFATREGRLYSSRDNGRTASVERDSSAPSW